MPSGVNWKARAEADIEEIAKAYPLAASQILDRIDRLAEDPVRLAQKPSFPHPLYPKYQFWIDDVDDDHNLYVTVLFSYTQDEQNIVIEGIGRLPVPKDYPRGA